MLLDYRNLSVFPAVNQRLYFAQELHKLLNRRSFDCICLEIPERCGEILKTACSLLPDIHIVLIHGQNQSSSFITVDLCDAMIMAAITGMQKEIPVECIDKNLPFPITSSHLLMGDDYPLHEHGIQKYYAAVSSSLAMFPHTRIDQQREEYMACKLDMAMKRYKRVLFVCGLYRWQGVRRTLASISSLNLDHIVPGSWIHDISIYKASEDSLVHITAEIPYIISFFIEKLKNGEYINKFDALTNLFYEAFNSFSGQVSVQRMQLLKEYSLKLARQSGYYTPDLIDILTAAKQIINEEFAHIVHKLAVRYYHFNSESLHPSVKIKKHPHALFFSALLGEKKIRLLKHEHLSFSRSAKKISLKAVPEEKYHGEWKDIWMQSVERVSHIPEDLALENCMQYIRGKIRELLKNSSSLLEFTGSLRDGIDLRETLRDIRGQKIYVREENKINVPVGNIVLIFDEKQNEQYSWKGVWYSEHSQESDLALFAAEPGTRLVGPGIAQAVFGGDASIYPAQGIINFFEFRNLLPENVKTDYEILLYTAVYYSRNTVVPFICDAGISAAMRSFAASRRVTLLHLKKSFFSFEKLRRLQKFHVLGDRKLRAIADKYIID